jgi:hypothetical protein
MGGETGANAPANPTLEILPRVPGGSTLLFLDWLERTDPNNLYPFLHVLPSGRIFVGEFETTDLSNLLTEADNATWAIERMVRPFVPISSRLTY